MSELETTAAERSDWSRRNWPDIDERIPKLARDVERALASPTPAIDKVVDDEIVRLMREDFDPTPRNWEGDDWYDNADEVADQIKAVVGAAVPETAAAAWRIVRKWLDDFAYEEASFSRYADNVHLDGVMTAGEFRALHAHLNPPKTAAIDKAIEALRLHAAYQAVPADSGGRDGPKARARTAFIEARDEVLSALRQPGDG